MATRPEQAQADLSTRGHGFGTAPVFLAAMSTLSQLVRVHGAAPDQGATPC